MKKDLFKETEEKLRIYYKKDKRINALKKRIDLLNKQIAVIDKDLRENNFFIEPGLPAQQYTERVQTSGDGTSYAEREMLRVIEAMIKRKTEKQLEKNNVSEMIDKIELEANNIEEEFGIKELSKEMKLLLELKYKKNYTEKQISQELHIDQARINRRKQQIIREMSLWKMW